MLIFRIIIVGMFSARLMALGAGVVCAQDYPNKPIRIITAQPGSGVDIMTRLIAPGLASSLGQQVIVDNRAGASGIIPIQAVAKAPADGYTLLLYGTGMWALPLMQKVPYDPLRDFAPITMVGSSPNILVVHPSLPVKTVKELIALAKARPGDLSYASGGTGASNHLAAEIFKSIAKVNILRIPYKGPASALSGLMSGETQLMFPNAASAAPHVKSGRFRALAVTSAQPSQLASGLPTVAASGLPGYESVFRVGMFAPAGTPTALVTRLNHETVQVLNSADIRERFFNTGSEPVGNSPEEMAVTIRTEMAGLGKVVKDAGIRAD